MQLSSSAPVSPAPGLQLAQRFNGHFKAVGVDEVVPTGAEEVTLKFEKTPMVSTIEIIAAMAPKATPAQVTSFLETMRTPAGSVTEFNILPAISTVTIKAYSGHENAVIQALKGQSELFQSVELGGRMGLGGVQPVDVAGIGPAAQGGPGGVQPVDPGKQLQGNGQGPDEFTTG